MSNTAYAYYAIYGDFDPTEISAVLGVPPTEVRVKGERGLGRVSQTSMWRLDSRLGQRSPLEAHVRDVLSQLDINAEAFQRMSRQFSGTMQLVSEFHVYPGLHFDRDIVDGLARFALAVDFDFYILPSTAQEDPS